ncbi:glycosyl hydrolase family 32 [Lactobacillus delbrueckii subsp. lactis DSM 20072]|uniref:glycoside hydrolase family 68 protein n=1 Tax=Lactobacillus delbrueckii TaxID=1584 RepID=UPI000552C61F|nr:glycoside hydrolase family 68 protein [Lactobacillus delbrueckii]ASW11203.1 glycosyl hydrolase family 32 [Lactobacillus delbrueckii subsp. lactis DSM 20072]MCT3500933.1 glycosyl hydrolase family 32 [Lactobacillus delbrueckii subsp. lactis]OOV10475.1 glycosyl hydrolase family 32 [Lactobacillus delbrueckii subsp. lactis DSM 20072]
MKKEEKKRGLFGKDYLMLSAMTIGLLAGAGKAQTVKADTVEKAKTEVKAATTATTTTANTTAAPTNTTTADTTTATNNNTAAGTNNTNTANNGTANTVTGNTNQATTGTTTGTPDPTNPGSTGTTTGTPDPTNPGSTGTNTGTKTDTKSTGNTTDNPGSASDNTQTHPGSFTGNTSSDETSELGKQNVSEDVSNENIGEGSVINSYLTTQAAKDNYAKLNDTGKKIVAAALREGSTLDLDKLTDTQIVALNKMVLNKTEDNQYTLKDYDSITKKIVERDSSSQIPLFKGEKIVNMPGLDKVKDAETGEEATMDIWDSWPVQDPETGYVQNWNGYQLAVAMMGIPHKSDSHLYLLYNKYGDNNFANWKVAGSIFGYNNDPKTGQWSGSAMLNADGSIQLFYANVLAQESNNQRVATITVNIGENADGVYIKSTENDHILFIGDGTVYQNYEQWKNSENRGANNPQMRDGHVFKDSDGTYYLAFETATGDLGDDPEGADNLYDWSRYGGNAAYNVSELFKLLNSTDMNTRAAVSNSAIGLLKLDMSDPKNPKVATDENGKQVLYKPLVKTVLSGDEIERPDLIKLNGKYYLFVDARVNHASDTDFAVQANIAVGDNVTMLGFVSDKVDGDYIPLNGDGLVLGASVPSTWRTATYSYYVVKINPANLKSDKITVNGVTYDKDYFVNHVVLINSYMGNRGEIAGKGLNSTLGPSFLVLVDGDKTTVLANSTTDQGVWDWNENSPKPELAAASLKEAKRSTDSYSFQVNKDGYWYLYNDSTDDGSIKMQTGFQYLAGQNKTVYYDPATGHMLYGFQKINGKTYYFAPGSGARFSGQIKLSGYWYLFSDKDGVMQTGFQYLAGQKKTVYYDPATGHMLYGLQKINGKTYYFAPGSGARVTGQIKINGKWYMFDKKTGVMQTGFQYIASQKKTVYYSPKTGQMLYGLQKINGKWYMFDKRSGAKISYQTVGTYIRLKHNAALYSAKGKKTKAKSYKKGLYTKSVGIRIIKGKVYYKLSNGKYIKAGNITVGKKRTLKKNAYIYVKKGKKVKALKGVQKKGSTKYTYGSVVIFQGKKFYAVASGKYIKSANF